MKLRGTHAATGKPAELSFSGTIESVGTSDAPEAAGETAFLAPGWIDLQVNGFAGVDYNSPDTSHQEIARSLEALFATGVTRVFPTVVTGSPERMAGALRNLARARAALPRGGALEAFHVEGPYISPEDGPRGAHPQAWVRPPDLDEFRRFQEAAEGNIRLLTVSPEWPGSARFIEAVVREGVVIGIGHTQATAGQIQDAVRAGATKSTHLGNGSHAVLPRHPNYIWEQLAEDRLTAGFIVDGIHLPQSFLKVALRAKGLERSLLVTDAVAPAGCAPGRYRLGEIEIELHADHSVRLAGETRLAGSALRMDHAIANVMRLGGFSLSEAVALASINPARVGRLAGRQSGLAPGERADVVRFTFESGRVNVLETYVNGERVYAA
ncbi:MAG TPA: amidohydrolase family protein [Terriglobia bacterium]|nr:amidohydrolase family protein [Terriglobia bacterium]